MNEDIQQVRRDNERCLQLLKEWKSKFPANYKNANLKIVKNGEGLTQEFLNTPRTAVLGPGRFERHPDLHPTGYRMEDPNDIRLILPTKGTLPMGCAKGIVGYGMIHPNLINAAVLQTYGLSSQQGHFDAMSLAPNFDLALTQREATQIAARKDPKIWQTLPGQAAKGVESELANLATLTWNKKEATEIYTRAAEKTLGKLSEREKIIFRWMCFHIYLGGSSTSNPCRADVFQYFHNAMGAQCEFMYDQMKGPGMTGLYASCGYTTYVKDLDAHMDEHMPRVTDMDPLLSDSYKWCHTRRGAISTRLVWVVSQLMNAYQQHHIDFCAVFALSEKEWEVWCQQWHMYKRDYAIGITHGINPKVDQRYELVCLYLETITRMEIQESPPGKKDAQAWVTFNPAKCTFCSQQYRYYDNVTNAVSAAWNHAVSCAETNLRIKGDGPTFPEGSMECMDYMSVIEAKMTKCGGLDFETNIEWLLTSLVETAICSRVKFFKSLIEDHKLSEKRDTEQQFGVSIPFLKLIANGQIFNPNFFHPRNNLIIANEDSKQCQQLLQRWIQAAEKVEPWGGLTIVRDDEALPGRGFSFSPNEKMGKVGKLFTPTIAPYAQPETPW